MKRKQYLRPIVGMAVFLLGICSAQASTVVYEDSDLVSNKTTSTSLPIDITQTGLYKAELVDFEYPDAFDILSLAITQGDTELGFGFDTGSFTFNVTTLDPLLAHLAAIPESGKQGLYALQIKAIPVPAAAWLLFSGLIGLIIVGRRDSGLETV